MVDDGTLLPRCTPPPRLWPCGSSPQPVETWGDPKKNVGRLADLITQSGPTSHFLKVAFPHVLTREEARQQNRNLSALPLLPRYHLARFVFRADCGNRPLIVSFEIMVEIDHFGALYVPHPPVEEMYLLWRMCIEDDLNHDDRAIEEYMNYPRNSFELIEILMDECAAGPTSLTQYLEYHEDWAAQQTGTGAGTRAGSSKSSKTNKKCCNRNKAAQGAPDTGNIDAGQSLSIAAPGSSSTAPAPSTGTQHRHRNE